MSPVNPTVICRDGFESRIQRLESEATDVASELATHRTNMEHMIRQIDDLRVDLRTGLNDLRESLENAIKPIVSTIDVLAETQRQRDSYIAELRAKEAIRDNRTKFVMKWGWMALVGIIAILGEKVVVQVWDSIKHHF